MNHLRQKNFEQVPMPQLYTYLNRLRNAEGPASISLGELKEWCDQYEYSPTMSDDECFVVAFINFDSDCEENSVFRLFMTSKRLKFQNKKLCFKPYPKKYDFQ